MVVVFIRARLLPRAVGVRNVKAEAKLTTNAPFLHPPV